MRWWKVEDRWREVYDPKTIELIEHSSLCTGGVILLSLKSFMSCRLALVLRSNTWVLDEQTVMAVEQR